MTSLPRCAPMPITIMTQEAHLRLRLGWVRRLMAAMMDTSEVAVRYHYAAPWHRETGANALR